MTDPTADHDRLQLVRRVVAEAVGTALLVAIVVGSGIFAERLTADAGLQLLENSIATLIALILAFGPVSGAHFNPVVTLADRVLGGISTRNTLAYIPAQILGGCVGSLLANLMFGLDTISVSTHARSSAGLWLSEVVATFGLLIVILGVVRSAGPPWPPSPSGAISPPPTGSPPQRPSPTLPSPSPARSATRSQESNRHRYRRSSPPNSLALPSPSLWPDSYTPTRPRLPDRPTVPLGMMFVVDELAGIQRGVDDLLPPGWRAEILGDRLVVNPPSGYEHNRLADRVQRLFLSRLPDHLDATVLGEGVYRDTGHAEYMVPDVVVFKPGQVNQDRLLGRDVELVGEIVSPTNRREADYEHEIVERASRFGIEWVLIVDPVTHTVSWWHESQPVDHGPKWTGEISWSDLNPHQAPRPSLLK